MDIQRLRQILKKLNLIFWNPEINRQLEKEGYADYTPIQSAEKRYIIIALRDYNPAQDFSSFPKSGPTRKRILANKNPEKKSRDKLFQEFQECLTPYDKVYSVLQREFSSSFAEQVLRTHQNLIEKFTGLSNDNYCSWTELMVCMSYEDFWTTPPAKPDSAKDNDGKKEGQTHNKKQRGRKALSKQESKKRETILKEWEKARSAGIIRDKFCNDKNITTKDLEKYQAFRRQRKTRSN